MKHLSRFALVLALGSSLLAGSIGCNSEDTPEEKKPEVGTVRVIVSKGSAAVAGIPVSINNAGGTAVSGGTGFTDASGTFKATNVTEGGSVSVATTQRDLWHRPRQHDRSDSRNGAEE